jgi:ATP-dependent DNA helicase RecG
VTPNTFKIILPNMNTASAESAETSPAVTGQMRRVVDYIKENGAITEAEMSELLGVKKTRTFLIAKAMTDLGLIAANGRGKNKKYYLV